jgi:8-oxo-dGTP pyrophosphatase MutT (NUDIX family)
MEPGTDIPYLQVGALPYRLSKAGDPEVLLVTSRGTRQWIIPKGWPIDGLSNPDSAAREAYEEAGIFGRIGETPVGVFTYEKPLKGTDAPSRFSVEVYLLRVERQLTDWPEAGERSLGWVSPTHAQSMVTNKSLVALIRTTQFPIG